MINTPKKTDRDQCDLTGLTEKIEGLTPDQDIEEKVLPEANSD